MRGGGIQKRTRSVEIEAKNGGRKCANEIEAEYRTCNTHRCRPRDCVYEWTDWSSHSSKSSFDAFKESKTGEDYEHWLKKEYDNFEEYPLDENGNPNQTKLSENSTCVADKKCTKECGGGKKYQYPEISLSKENMGYCPSRKEAKCYLDERDRCPTDCKTQKGNWNACSLACGQGAKTQNVRILTHPRAGFKCGMEHPANRATLAGRSITSRVRQTIQSRKACNPHACPPQTLRSFLDIGV